MGLISKIGTILALFVSVMKRWLFVSAIGAVSALGLLQLSQPDAPAPPTTNTALDADEAHPLPAVQVEQLLIEADLVRPIEPANRPVAVPVATRRHLGAKGWTTAPSTRSAAADLDRLQHASAPPPMFERAKRALVGNGRYRPEPFPRLKDN